MSARTASSPRRSLRIAKNPRCNGPQAGVHTLLEAARAGVGVAVLPRFVARQHDELVRVSDNVAEHDVWLITHPEFRRDPKVRATAEFLRRMASEADGLC